MRTRLALAGLAICALGILPGCASKRSEVTAHNHGKVFAVVADKTSFYRYGPQQGNGADQELPRDTLVTLIRPSFGYCKVQLVQGAQEGYVASEDIKPAPPTLLAALNPPAPTPESSSELENFDVNSSEPPPPEGLPAPDLPPTGDSPAPQ